MRDRAVAQSNAAARRAPAAAGRCPRAPRGRRRLGGLLDQVVNAVVWAGRRERDLDAIFGHRPPPPGAGVPGAGVPGAVHTPLPPGVGSGSFPPRRRRGARKARDHALREHIRHIPAMNDDEFEDLLAAGFFDQPPPPGGPPGLEGTRRRAERRPAPGELPEGVIGPIRRARMERKKRRSRGARGRRPSWST